MIQLTHARKIYQTSTGPVEALSDVSLKVERGEIFGVIGYSGAGKSTLIRLINLLEKPTSGNIEVDGRVLSDLSEKELRGARKQIGMIFQHFNLLWSRTVAENIAFPLELSGLSREKKRQRVDELIRMVGLEGRASSYPAQLSGGQKQRVGIARALATNPKVLLCDEATSALDPKTTDSILQLLKEINQSLGITIVLITHEMHVIRKICSRVAVLDHGTIVEEGRSEDVFANPQQPITREFVGRTVASAKDSERVQRFRKAFPDGKIVRIRFDGSTSQESALDTLFHDQAIHASIIESEFSPTEIGSKGTLILLIDGSEDDIHAALQSLETKKVKAEVLPS
ncbi:ATP-binding cassette domain-containing protein [Sporolactobacillus shoreae]|uniref:ATP-binding cassette domain-containing protein n=1 Tax=Sporolactobacillus shoreae TaxID=1465501 RepID=A0A4Z0GMZ1_9BACL|nr:ATP-binding cassette domain-containing protein [Sporolactobacillus shoreae]TGA97243.1 ATP-binding cassette domain-containing protein [Sporolactobacillus shoreae]